MIKVTVDIGDQEYEAEFIQVERENKVQWQALLPIPEEGITIYETKDGFDEKNISLSAGIATNKIVVLERFLRAYAEYKEQLQTGLEATDENPVNVIETKPYNPDDIKVRRESFSVFEVNRMMTEQNDIDLNPDFQRNLVWENSRKSALIESILLGIPIPVFYFAESKNGIYRVVDGLQRLSTIKQYLNNEFYLKKLEHLKDCEKKYYKLDGRKAKTEDKVLERKHSRRLENAQLFVNIIESASPSKVKYDIFKRINTGGRPLNNQEVRNCIAEDEVRRYLRELSATEEFQNATGGSISDYRMDAQELVLRFTGFKLEREGLITYSGDMNSFLDDVLDLVNGLPKTELKRLSAEFLKSLRINYHLFGQYCFRKVLSSDLLPKARKQTINKALFVTWTIEVLRLDEKKIIQNVPFESFAQVLATKLDEKDKYYTILTTGTSDKQNLKDAAEFASNLLDENLNGNQI